MQGTGDEAVDFTSNTLQQSRSGCVAIHGPVLKRDKKAKEQKNLGQNMLISRQYCHKMGYFY